MEALVFLLTTPTIGAPPRVCPLPKALLPVLLPKGLVEPLVVVVPGVPEVPDESVPVLVGEDEVMLPVDGVVPPKDDVLPRGFDVRPGVPPRTFPPAVVERPPF